MLPAHSLVKVTFVSTRPGILRSRRILNHAKPSITAGGMKITIGRHSTIRDMESWAVCYCHFKKCQCKCTFTVIIIDIFKKTVNLVMSN
jgi:hypothetical protein